MKIGGALPMRAMSPPAGMSGIGADGARRPEPSGLQVSAALPLHCTVPADERRTTSPSRTRTPVLVHRSTALTTTSPGRPALGTEKTLSHSCHDCGICRRCRDIAPGHNAVVVPVHVEHVACGCTDSRRSR